MTKLSEIQAALGRRDNALQTLNEIRNCKALELFLRSPEPVMTEHGPAHVQHYEIDEPREIAAILALRKARAEAALQEAEETLRSLGIEDDTGQEAA